MVQYRQPDDRSARALKSGPGVGSGNHGAYLGLNSLELLDLVVASARLGTMAVPFNRHQSAARASV